MTGPLQMDPSPGHPEDCCLHECVHHMPHQCPVLNGLVAAKYPCDEWHRENVRPWPPHCPECNEALDLMQLGPESRHALSRDEITPPQCEKCQQSSR